tara:strand:- start:100 stop:444 length:345 start_codon:yes stop_codon:yes gene_type:complete
MPVNDNGQEYRTSICKASKKNAEKYPGCGNRIVWKLPYVAGSRPFDDILFEYQHQCTGQVTSSVESMIKPITQPEVERMSHSEATQDLIKKAYYSKQLTTDEVRMLFKILAKLV